MTSGAARVVIVGAGAVGTTYAYVLQMSGVARRIVLIDLDRERAEAEALDLQHGLPFTPPVQILAGDYDDCADADIIVIAAGAKQKPGQSRTDLLGTNVEICKSIMTEVTRRTEEAILLVVTNPVDVLTYAALRFSGLPKARVMGAGTVLDSARFRFLLSRHCRVDTRNVHAYILGEHGDSEVAAWSMVHIAGMTMDEYCKSCPLKCSTVDRTQVAEQVRDSAYHIIDAKGATNYAVGLALLRITTAILRDENSILTVSSLLEGELGIRGVCLSVPQIVNRGGVDRLLCPSLSEDELAALMASAEAIRNVQRTVGL